MQDRNRAVPAVQPFVRCADLSEALRIEAAQLAVDAMSTLYAGFRDDAVHVLAEEFVVPGSELAEAAAIVGGQVDALIAGYPAVEFSARQRMSLYHALRGLPNESAAKYVDQLRVISREMGDCKPHGYYIARFAVRQELRGSGIADTVMNMAVSEHPQISLHVRADNLRAIYFYRRHGFTRGPCAGAPFMIMHRG